MPGLVRISFGLYNTIAEIDILIDALESIVEGDYQGEYVQDTATGEYRPKARRYDFTSYLDI
jgi:hypothetical protein